MLAVVEWRHRSRDENLMSRRADTWLTCRDKLLTSLGPLMTSLIHDEFVTSRSLDTWRNHGKRDDNVSESISDVIKPVTKFITSRRHDTWRDARVTHVFMLDEFLSSRYIWWRHLCDVIFSSRQQTNENFPRVHFFRHGVSPMKGRYVYILKWLDCFVTENPWRSGVRQTNVVTSSFTRNFYRGIFQQLNISQIFTCFTSANWN